MPPLSSAYSSGLTLGRLQVSKSYSFSIDTTEAGFGELKVTAHGHTGPKSLSVIGNGVHFTPLKVGPLKIEVRFDGVAVLAPTMM